MRIRCSNPTCAAAADVSSTDERGWVAQLWDLGWGTMEVGGEFDLEPYCPRCAPDA